MVHGVAPRVRAAILAGGHARRLAGRKATARLCGRSLISFPLEAARVAGLDPVVVAKRGTSLPELDCEVIREPDRPVHPLRGILTALESCAAAVVVLGCDMPFVTAPLLRWLAECEPPAVAAVDGQLEPLLAVYAQADAPGLGAALAEHAPLRRAVEGLGPERMGEDDLGRFGDPHRLAMSVNTEADLAKAARLFSD